MKASVKYATHSVSLEDMLDEPQEAEAAAGRLQDIVQNKYITQEKNEDEYTKQKKELLVNGIDIL